MNGYLAHATAMARTQAILGDDCPFVIFDDTNVPVIPGSAQRRADLGPGGFSMNADFVFEALVASFGDFTAKDLKDKMLQSPLGYLDDGYKIVSVHIRPGGLQIKIECNSIGQNA